MQEDIERLLLEAQRSKYTERRTEARHSFTRPVQVFVGDRPGYAAFSKDVSSVGIGIICDREFEIGSIAVLKIHSVQGTPVYIRCEVRWSDPFGKGWYLIGWKFLATSAPPARALCSIGRVDTSSNRTEVHDLVR